MAKNNNNQNDNKNNDKNVEKHHHKNTTSKYTVEQIAHMGGEAGGNAPHKCRGFQCQEPQFGGPNPGAMGPKQAGHLGGEAGGHKGGIAPHVCRGLQCLKEEEEGKRVKGQENNENNENYNK